MSGTSGLRKHTHTSAGDGGHIGIPASETFVAAGASPETFTLAAVPTGICRVYLEGLRVAPAFISVSGDEVDVDTTAGDVVIVDYEV